MQDKIKIDTTKTTAKDACSEADESFQSCLEQPQQQEETAAKGEPARHWINRWIRHFPRTMAVFWGVVLPLWLLVFVSVLSGFVLAYLEAPLEGKN